MTKITSSLNTAVYAPAAVATSNLCSSNPRRYSTATKQTLLKFPALKLEETLPKWIKTIEPHLSKEELEATLKEAQQFQAKDGAELQKLLEQQAANDENWLAHRWLKAAYLTYRDPVTVFSSPGMTFPMQQFKTDADYYMYTAKLIQGLIKYKKIVDNGQVPVVKMGKNELDNSQFSAVYGTCRIPLANEDALEYNPKSQHVTVLYKNHVSVKGFTFFCGLFLFLYLFLVVFQIACLQQK